MISIFIYSGGFVLATLALVAWFYFQDKKAGPVFQKTLFAALGLYLLGVVFAPAEFGDKLSAVFRDLLVLGAVGLVFQLIFRKRATLIIGLAVLFAALSWYFKNKLKPSFVPTEAITQLDASAELLVEIAENRDVSVLAEVARKYDLEMVRAFDPQKPEDTELDDYFTVNIPDNRRGDLEEIKTALSETAHVDWVEENEVITLDPVDLEPAKKLPEINKKYGIDDPGIAQLWAFEALQVDALYAVLEKNKIKPQRKAVIAILDTGIDAKHEDIKDNYHSIQTKHDNDPRNHGTHCAGIAAAVSNNGKGVASFSKDNSFVRVSSIKVLSASGMGTQQSIMKGMIEAADAGVDVISMSLGGLSSAAKQKAYEKAVDYANRAGAVVVAAAGNSNRNATGFAPVNSKGVIGVSAVDQELNRAVFSNYVTDLEMGVAAPGVGIYSTIPGDKYAAYNGTSMATPYVAGLVGLLKSINPKLTTQQIYDLLNNTGTETKNTGETGRLINPAGAVEAAWRLVQ